jgi:hypothetical protein
MASATTSGPSVGSGAAQSRTVFDDNATANMVLAHLSARDRGRVETTATPLCLTVRRFYKEVVKPAQLGKKSILDRLQWGMQEHGLPQVPEHRNIYDLSDANIWSDKEFEAVLGRIGCVPTGIAIGWKVDTAELDRTSWGGCCSNLVVFTAARLGLHHCSRLMTGPLKALTSKFVFIRELDLRNSGINGGSCRGSIHGDTNAS